MQTVKHASRPHSQGQALKALKKELRKNAGLYLLALIPFVYLILFKYWPMYGVQIAFRDYRVADGIWGSQWVGLKHFSRFLHTPKFLDIMKNTIIISLYGVLTFPLPILLAVMLNYLSFPRYRKCIQMVSYAPHFISTVVMVAILMQFLDKNNGLLNTLIEALGGKRVNFMAKREYFYHIYQWYGRDWALLPLFISPPCRQYRRSCMRPLLWMVRIYASVSGILIFLPFCRPYAFC